MLRLKRILNDLVRCLYILTPPSTRTSDGKDSSDTLWCDRIVLAYVKAILPSIGVPVYSHTNSLVNTKLVKHIVKLISGGH